MITEILTVFGCIIISIVISHTICTIIEIKETLDKIYNNLTKQNNIEYRKNIINENR